MGCRSLHFKEISSSRFVCVCGGGLIKTNDKHRHKTFINYRFPKLYDNLANTSAVFVCSFSLKD